MKIRKMALQDVLQVKQLIDSKFPTRIKLDALLSTLESSDSYTLVGIVNNEIVVTVGIRESIRVCWLASKYTKRGYARRIMKYILDSMDHSYLRVKRENYPAIHLYLSLGYTIVERGETSITMTWNKK